MEKHPLADTGAIRQQARRSDFREHSVPLYLSSSFVFDSAEQMRDTFADQEEGLIYSRYNNPNTDELVAKVCVMEGAEEGLATASGMAAVFASMAGLLRSGDHIIASRALFGSTFQILTQILPRWGITCSFVDPTRVDTWEEKLQPNTKMLVLESPSNPGLALVDLEAAGAFTHTHGLIFNIDNCFATSILQRPIEYGADLVMHSATKWMDGQGRVLGGLLVGRKDLLESIRFFYRHTGPSMSPFNAWVLSKSLETLPLRLERHCQNAMALAQWLEQQPKVKRVWYPHLPSHPQYELARRQMLLGGGIVTFEAQGGVEGAMQVLNALQLCSRTANLGDTRTIVTHPATTTHSKLPEDERLAVGITPGLIRVSVGLEQIADIIADFEQALAGN